MATVGVARSFSPTLGSRSVPQRTSLGDHPPISFPINPPSPAVVHATQNRICEAAWRRPSEQTFPQSTARTSARLHQTSQEVVPADPSTSAPARLTTSARADQPRLRCAQFRRPMHNFAVGHRATCEASNACLQVLSTFKTPLQSVTEPTGLRRVALAPHYHCGYRNAYRGCSGELRGMAIIILTGPCPSPVLLTC